MGGVGRGGGSRCGGNDGVLPPPQNGRRFLPRSVGDPVPPLYSSIYVYILYMIRKSRAPVTDSHGDVFLSMRGVAGGVLGDERSNLHTGLYR